MATTVLRSPEMDGIAAEIFDLLWGAERPAIPTAVDHAYERIWRKLIAGEWQPGERLSDLDLAAQLQVSRTPVRQALHRLAQDELVRFDPRRGFSVREFTVPGRPRDVRRAGGARGAGGQPGRAATSSRRSCGRSSTGSMRPGGGGRRRLVCRSSSTISSSTTCSSVRRATGGWCGCWRHCAAR